MIHIFIPIGTQLSTLLIGSQFSLIAFLGYQKHLQLSFLIAFCIHLIMVAVVHPDEPSSSSVLTHSRSRSEVLYQPSSISTDPRLPSQLCIFVDFFLRKLSSWYSLEEQRRGYLLLLIPHHHIWSVLLHAYVRYYYE